MSAWIYILVWAAVLVDQLFGFAPAGWLAGIGILAFLTLEFRNQRRYAQWLFGAMLTLGLIGVALSSHPLPLFLASWRRGATYAAFFLSLGVLREAAESSALVKRCGGQLVAQPPGRRYAALTGGGHVFGVILSYGAIDLLGAMVARANTLEAAGGSEEVRAIRLRRMLLAIYRGFCVMNCWSPLNMMTAVVSGAVPAAPMRLLLPIAFAVSVVMMGFGWLEDRLSAARRTTRGGTRAITNERWSIHLPIAMLVLAVMLSAEALATVGGISLVTAVTLLVPLVGFGWIALDELGRRTGWGLGRLPVMMILRFRRFLRRVPTFRGEATVLAGSGFMGVALSGALPAGGLMPLLSHLPPLFLPLAAPVLLILTGQVGLNPIAVVALLGTAIPDPAALGVAPAVLAFAYMLGWGLAVGMTPVSASAITTARWAGVSPWTVSTVWNGPYTLSILVLAWAATIALDRLGGPIFMGY